MFEKRQDVAVISVTLNAVNPMMESLTHLDSAKSWRVKNYLDEGLQANIAEDGGVKDRSLCRMVNLIEKAVDGHAQAILLTCTVYSPYIAIFRQMFSVPIIGADLAMLEMAAKLESDTAILCTFPAAVEPSWAMFQGMAKQLGLPCKGTSILVEGALPALASGDRKGHDALVAASIRHHAKNYGAIVLAQMSMASAAALVPDCPVPLLTSPGCAVAAIQNLLGA